MKFILGAAFIFLLGCGEIQTENSFTGDDEIYAAVEGSANFQAARTVLVNQCSDCHPNYAGYSEQEFISNGFVVAGDPSGSKLFSSIRFSNVGGEEDMPLFTTLSNEEIETIRNWISSI